VRGVNDFTLSNGKGFIRRNVRVVYDCGVRKAHEQVFLMKLGWGILNDKCSSREWLLRAKYVKSQVEDQQLHSRNTDSSVWKEICKVWPQVIAGTYRLVHREWKENHVLERCLA